MNFGIENNKFYVEYSGCSRIPGSLKEESDIRAREIYTKNKKIFICLSSGLDSQIAMYSFLSQDIPVEFAFLRLDGYNDNELENIKKLENRWGFKTHIININPNKIIDELEHLSLKLDAHYNHCLQYKFVSELPEDYGIVQVLHDPWSITSRKLKKHYVFHGYYDPEIARYRILKEIPRSGDIYMFGDSQEFFLSCINDELFHYFFQSWQYYEKNGLLQYDKELPDVLRYEYYIKPMLYAKHWKNSLMYFPKFSGYENIDWLMKSVRVFRREKIVMIEWNKLIEHLLNLNAPSIRYYELPQEYLALLRR